MAENTQKHIGGSLSDTNRIQTNRNRIWTLATEGRSVEEISSELSLNDMGGIKNALMEMMAEKGEKLEIDGLDRASVNPAYTGEGIRIDPAMLEGSDYRKGDKFDIKVTPDSIILKKRKI